MHDYSRILHILVDIYGFYTGFIRFFHRIHTVESAYTYGSFGLYIYMCRLKRPDVFAKTAFRLLLRFFFR